MQDRAKLPAPGRSLHPVEANASATARTAARSPTHGAYAAFGHDFSRIRVHDAASGVIHRDMEDMIYNPSLFGGLPSFGDIAGGIGGGISSLGGLAGSAASGIGSAIGGGISGAANMGGDLARGIGGLFGEGSPGAQIGDIAGSAISGIGGVLGGAASGLGSRVGSSIGGAASDVGSFISNLPNMSLPDIDPSMLQM